MSNVPADLKYSSDHEWVHIEDDGSAVVGITDHAQGALGDLVFVEAPEPGSVFASGEAFVPQALGAMELLDYRFETRMGRGEIVWRRQSLYFIVEKGNLYSESTETIQVVREQGGVCRISREVIESVNPVKNILRQSGERIEIL